MDPKEWLSNFHPEFKDLSEEEISAILYFTLLGGLFEARAFNENGATAPALQVRLLAWGDSGLLRVANFEGQLAYFKERYFRDGEPTRHYAGLNFRPRDNEGLVRRVLGGGDATDVEKVVAVFLVIWRFRNNLFHGAKWQYFLEGQLRNFQEACLVLMRALEIEREMVERQ